MLGDLVGYGAEPAQVVDAVMQLAAAGAVVLGGNHDAMAVQPPAQEEHQGDTSARWTHGQLDAAQRAFLAGLALQARVASAWLVHASADSPGDLPYGDNPQRSQRSLDAACAPAGVSHVFSGHLHHPRLYYRGGGRALMEFMPTPGVAIPVPAHRQWLATVGSVGQPRDGDTRAMYALFDATQARLGFHRVAYDHRAAAQAVRHTAQPEWFAQRLEEGR